MSFDGAASKLGSYPPLPANQYGASSAKLDAEGLLYEFAHDDREAFRDTIVRRSVQGASEVIYDEIYNPRVKIHISNLITGP